MNDTFYECEFCGCFTNAAIRGCCEEGSEADKNKNKNKDVPTIKELMLCLPIEDREKILKMVENAHLEIALCGDITETEYHYNFIENEIKKYVAYKKTI